MDLSKLPKLSQTKEQTPDAPAAEPTQAPGAYTGGFCQACGVPLRLGARFCDACGASTLAASAPSTAADVWVSGILGLIFMLLGRNFGRYLFSLITRQPYHTGVNWVAGDLAGTEVAYPDLDGFVIWNDSAIFLFGLALLLEAIALAVSRTGIRFGRAISVAALSVAILATLYNVVVAIKLFSHGILPILSLLAIAYGGYLAMTQWNAMKNARISST